MSIDPRLLEPVDDGNTQCGSFGKSCDPATRVQLIVLWFSAVVLFSMTSIATECVIKSRLPADNTFNDIYVRTGTSGFHVDVRGVAASQLRVPRWPGDSFEVSVGGAVSFKGTLKDVSLTVVAPTESTDKMVRLMPGVSIVDAYSSGNDVVVSVVFAYGCPNEGLHEILRSTRVPCVALGFGYANHTSEAAVAFLGREDENEVTGSLRNPFAGIRLRSAPREDSAILRISNLRGDGAPFEVQILEERGRWVKVKRWSYFDATATGWIHEFEMAKERVVGSRVFGFGMCSFPPPTPSLWGDSKLITPTERVPPSWHVDAARIAPGTKVFGTSGAWGTIADESIFTVRYEGRDTVSLVAIPGLSGSELRAWVPLSAVTFPNAGK